MRINEENFILQAKRKNEKALDYIIEQYGWIIKTVIQKQLCHLPDYQSDCMNDVLLGIWNHIDCFEPEKSSFKNWAAGIARYKVIDYRRKYLKILEREILEEAEIPAEDLVQKAVLENEISEEIQQILSCLTTEDQQIFKRLFLEDVSMEDVSKETGLRKDALYNRISRGKKKIRKYFPQFIKKEM